MTSTPLALVLTVLIAVEICSSCHAFLPLPSMPTSHHLRCRNLWAAETEDNDSDIPKALAPSTNSTLIQEQIDSPSGAGTTAFMITRDQKRILIEELGYSRRDIDVLRVELATPIIEKRISCPSNGIPIEWVDTTRSEQDAMIRRLENESKDPLKFPLFVVSGVLVGKGSTDAIVTLIKVSQGFRGASLSEEFMGVNVLAIDALCVAVGIGLALWTSRAMKDDGVESR